MSFAALADTFSASPSGPITAIPYAALLGVHYEIAGAEVTLSVPFERALVGQPSPPRLHGGAVAGMLELAAAAQVVLALKDERPLPEIAPVNVTVDYLRAGQPERTFIAARIVRLGRRIANVNVEAWQADRDRPIAAAHTNLIIRR